MTPTTKERLTGKTEKEKANIKADLISMAASAGEYSEGKLSIDIQSIQKIDGGVEVFVRAWDGEEQYGFGDKGDVEIERVRIYNPPLLVDDPIGSIVVESTNDKGEVTQRHLREDPDKALKEVIAHVVRRIGKKNTDITEGKVGNTTSVFYPAVDGRTQRAPGASESWATIIAGAGNAHSDSDTNRNVVGPGASTSSNTYDSLLHGWFKFDTSAIPDTDVVSAATLGLYIVSSDGGLGGAVAFVQGTVASTTVLADSDHLNYGVTRWVDTDWTLPAATGAIKNAVFNATGIAAVNKTGYTTIALILDKELSGTPTWVSAASSLVEVRLVEFTGTSSDPTLTVVHAAAGTSGHINLPVLGAG